MFNGIASKQLFPGWRALVIVLSPLVYLGLFMAPGVLTMFPVAIASQVSPSLVVRSIGLLVTLAGLLWMAARARRNLITEYRISRTINGDAGVLIFGAAFWGMMAFLFAWASPSP